MSFAALGDGELEVNVRIAKAEPEPRAGAVRAIRVPFTVPATGKVAIASIGEEHPVALAPGAYAPTHGAA